MGIITSGILGPMLNKTGATIGRMHRGQNVITGLYKERSETKEPTPNQTTWRKKFALLNIFLNDIEPLVSNGFKKAAKGGSAVNAAFSYNCDHAFIGDDENPQLNFPNIVYSRGHVEPPESLQMLTEDHLLIMNWLSVPQSMYSQHSDKASILLCSVETGATAKFVDCCERSDLSITLDMEPLAGHTLHCYISLASADGKQQGQNAYLGLIEIPAASEENEAEVLA